MAITHFIPALWAANLQVPWDEEKVFPALLDRQYEGVATRGNTVHIPGLVPPTVKDYKAANRTTSPDAITDTGVDLLIDQERVVDFKVDDIDAKQAAGGLGAYTENAAQGLVRDADIHIADMLVADGTVLPGSTPTTGDQAFNLVKAARTALNKSNAPGDGRVIVLTPDFEGLLLGADSKLSNFDTSGDNNGLRRATIGMLLGFRVLWSNNLPGADDEAGFVAFHPSAAAFVSQLEKFEALRDNDSIADRIRGLHVYGAKVVRPEGVVTFGLAGGS